MTDQEIGQFTEFYAEQCGVSDLKAVNQVSEWHDRFRRVGLANAKNAIKAILLSERVPHGAGKLFGEVLRICSGGDKSRLNQRDEKDLEACGECDYSGIMTVPHLKDYDHNGWWRGEHDMAVACRCERAVVLFRSRMMTIDQYDQIRPNWREEYPLRYVERQAHLGRSWARLELERLEKLTRGAA